MTMYKPNWNQIINALEKAADADGIFSGSWVDIARICGIPSDVDVHGLFNENRWRFSNYHAESGGVQLTLPR